MSSAEQTPDKKDAPPTATETTAAPSTTEKMSDDAAAKKADPAAEPDATQASQSAKTEKPAEVSPVNSGDKPEAKASDEKDVEMKDANETQDAAAPAGDAAETKADADTSTAAVDSADTPDKSKDKSRRKSSSVPEHKGKKLNKKGSKARVTNIGAQPGDLFLMKLKGYPPWPVIICDEDMLPQSLLLNRPVAAKRPDGTYREDFADGGKRTHDRVFPVMYLYTNEFGWVNNMTLQELTPERAGESINDRMRKDLQAAYELASQGNNLDYYKEMLRTFQEEAIAREQAKQAKQAAKAEAAAKPDTDDDVDMEDAGDTETPAKKSKKRKAEGEAATPQRSDSVKKPKIKITSSATKSAANGASTPKSAKEQGTSKAASKPAPKKMVEEKKAEPAAPKEPELSPEERHKRKEKEVLFLRHKLQKGLLTRDQEPKEEEMKMMSDYLTKLEGFPELEVSIIRATKINKVLKAILKLESIPKETEFDFKNRSQVLLDKWNKLLADAPAAASAPAASAEANGVNGVAKKEKASKPGPNGVADGADGTAKGGKTPSEAADKPAAKSAEKEAEVAPTKAAEETKPIEGAA